MEIGTMRTILIVILVAVAGWCGYWAFGAWQTERAVKGWLQARVEDGWVVHTDAVRTRGFPFRLDTSLTGIDTADPNSGLSWQAPEFEILSLAYRPTRLVLAWPADQTIATPLDSYAVHSATLRGSMAVLPAVQLPFDHFTVATGPMTITAKSGWTMSLAKGQLAMRRTPDQPQNYDLALDLEDLTPPAGWTGVLPDPGGALGRVVVNATIGFDRDWDLRALSEQRPQPQQIALSDARISWGELNLQASGTLKIDAQGQPSGKLDLRATNWKAMLDAAAKSGAMNPDLAKLIQGGLAFLAKGSADGRSLNTSIVFADGRMALAGMIPLGPAPVLRLR